MATAKKITLIGVVAAAFALPASAQAATTTVTIPLQANVLACNGDTITLRGQLLSVFTTKFDAAGGVMIATHSQPQGVAGIDVQTGTKYIGTGLTRDINVFAPSGTTTITFINRFHIQATAGGESFEASSTVHLTSLADGSVTASVDKLSASC